MKLLFSRNPIEAGLALDLSRLGQHRAWIIRGNGPLRWNFSVEPKALECI